MSCSSAATRGYMVARTSQTLELLAFQPVTAAQLAATLGMHPRTARRVIERLVLDEYVEKGLGQRAAYYPTARLHQLGLRLASARRGPAHGSR